MVYVSIHSLHGVPFHSLSLLIFLSGVVLRFSLQKVVNLLRLKLGMNLIVFISKVFLFHHIF